MRARGPGRARRSGARPVRDILDLGCGPGRDDECFGARGYRVTAIDWSPAMVAEARRAHARSRSVAIASTCSTSASTSSIGCRPSARASTPRIRISVRSTACVDLDGAARLIAARLGPAACWWHP